jgi:endonuclease/exonuclease/phosphatase family metal-dependent hydrolase
MRFQQATHRLPIVTTALLGIFFAASVLRAPVSAEPQNEGANDPDGYVLSFGPALLAWADLMALSSGDPIGANLDQRLDALFRTPFVSNAAHPAGSEARKPEIGDLGPGLRIVTWNVQKGLHLDAILEALGDPQRFLRTAPSRTDRRAVSEEIALIESADVWVLNEVDWGLSRSCYRNVAAEIAEVLGMNWAFGVEFVEIDPLVIGTEEAANESCHDPPTPAAFPPTASEQSTRDTAPGPVFGLHGVAVLSRYPIVDARLEPFDVQGYDWDGGERGGQSPLERGRRLTAEYVFRETIEREIRKGGRTSLIVTLEVPDLDEKRLTVAATHLEGRAKPEVRRLQMNELLENLREVAHPVILAGDLNTTLGDHAPTSFKREAVDRVRSPRFWAGIGIKLVTGLGLIYDAANRGVSWLVNQDDPTSSGVPIVAPNPERDLFRDIESFRSAGGHAFDFRGDARRTLNATEGTLANSNERDRMGFVTTYELGRTFGPIGKYKLDWILVKSYLRDPRAEDGPYRFAPHFPRTLHELNHAIPGGRISDHSPITVDLPFDERR